MALAESALYSMPLEVYLQSSVIRGTLVTRHDRLSDHLSLRASDEVFSLRDAKVEDLNGDPLLLRCKEYLLCMPEVLFIADLSVSVEAARTNLDHLQIKKETKKALLHLSPFWIRGNVHLIPGVAFRDLLVVKNRFIPVTEATLVGRTNVTPGTFLVNRTKISCLAEEGQPRP